MQVKYSSTGSKTSIVVCMFWRGNKKLLLIPLRPLFKEIKDICFCLQAGIRASKQLQFSQNFALPKKQFVSYSSETEHSFLSTLLCACYILLLCLHKAFLLKHGIFGRIGKANIFRWHHCLCLALRETGRTEFVRIFAGLAFILGVCVRALD